MAMVWVVLTFVIYNYDHPGVDGYYFPFYKYFGVGAALAIIAIAFFLIAAVLAEAKVNQHSSNPSQTLVKL